MRTFGELLRRFRVKRGLTQAQLAARLAVQRATFTQWESGRHLPRLERVRELDDLLQADGGLVAAAEQLRPAIPQPRPAVLPDPTVDVGGRNLLQVFRDIRRAFLDQLQCDEHGRPIGWRHNLVQSDEAPTIVSTVFGLRVLALLGGPDGRTPAIVERVLKRAVRTDDGRLVGWTARPQAEPRLEMTAEALEALLVAGVPIPVDDVLRVMGALVDDTARERPYVLSAALRPLLRVAPDAEFTAALVQSLLDCRLEFGGELLWPEKRLSRDQPLIAPSVVHTARAVTVLRDAPPELLGDALPAAEQWLTEVEDVNGVSEIIRRRLPEGRTEELTIDHLTSAWVARALAGGAAPNRSRIGHALRHVWARYDDRIHFWAWGNGDVPVWMLADAVAALQEAAFALTQAPVSPPQ